jgi:internalin A
VCLYEGTTHSRARIEQRSSETPTTWSGQILISTRGGQAMELLERLKEWIGEELTRSGCQDAKLIEPTTDKPRSARMKKASPHRTVKTEPEDKAPAPPLNFRAPPSDAISYCVSYAWNDESKALVDHLCEQAKQRGITILRDINGLRLRASITRFMQGLAKGDRVFVVLSDK